ncbi:MAG TPA: carbohydrate-binding family 9-like protein [Verrucomicrobiae bacterium]|nr:carbohydrate-binding family 9-like protein [Verrucomicrobiae bacterium]
MKPVLPCILLAAAALTGAAQAGFLEDWEKLRSVRPQGYVCGRAAGMVMDGKLEEKSWAAAEWTSDFQDIEGSAKPKPRFRTRAKMLWDDNYFYIAAELEEAHVWGSLTNHDAVIFQDPDFEIFIDPDGDRHNYYEFEMNALNTGWDLILKKPYIDGGPALNEWEIPGLKTAVQIKGTLNDPRGRDEGWTVEIALPWKVLGEFSRQKSPPQEGDIWRVDFSRVEWHVEIREGKYKKVGGTKEDNWVWN